MNALAPVVIAVKLYFMIAESQNLFIRNQASFYPVIPFDPEKQRLVAIDFTDNNTDLTAGMLTDTAAFTQYMSSTLKSAHSDFGIGGYAEHRSIYSRSRVFDGGYAGDEPRRVHLGIDIWGPAGTPVFAPVDGMVHGFAFNDHYGDYGATVILLHQLDGFAFYTLYGHLSLQDIQVMNAGQYIIRAEQIGRFGESCENGHWPPHLHFQVIFDIGVNEGDYPGVCKYSERVKYLNNCPDPDLILQMRKYL